MIVRFATDMLRRWHKRMIRKSVKLLSEAIMRN
jgi:hypothetical protein